MIPYLNNKSIKIFRLERVLVLPPQQASVMLLLAFDGFVIGEDKKHIETVANNIKSKNYLVDQNNKYQVAQSF